MKEFCKLNLTFSQDGEKVKAEGPVHFEGTYVEQVYVLANVCKALHIDHFTFISFILPRVMGLLRAKEVQDGGTE